MIQPAAAPEQKRAIASCGSVVTSPHSATSTQASYVKAAQCLLDLGRLDDGAALRLASEPGRVLGLARAVAVGDVVEGIVVVLVEIPAGDVVDVAAAVPVLRRRPPGAFAVAVPVQLRVLFHYELPLRIQPQHFGLVLWNGNRPAVGKLQSFNPILAEELFGLAVHEEMQATFGQFLLQ